MAMTSMRRSTPSLPKAWALTTRPSSRRKISFKLIGLAPG